MNPIIKSKLPNAGTTIFTEMSVLAAAHNAINLGQGFPDFGMNPELQNLVAGAMHASHNQYVHMNGLPLLRERIAEKAEKLYATKLNANDEITITPGGTYALYTALTTILSPGDEVIVFEPAYDSYISGIEINGAKAVSLPLSLPDYKIDWELVKANVNDRTKAIMINSPHNPTGAVLEEEDITALKEIVKGTGIFIISDEVYEHIIFDGKKHLSILKYPELYERSFVCFSFGKVYHCTGWKMGYCIAPPALMKEFRKIHQFNAFTCFGPVQYALADFLQKEAEYLQLGSFLQQKRDYFLQLMKQTKFEPLPSHGSYFQLYSYAKISDEKEKDFAVRLTKEYGVTTIPVSAFYQNVVENKVVRFCFSKKEETLEAAAEKLVKL
jgi:methionine aminotransferase